ncbi:MAG: hypothetical protein Tsb0020_50230 [Haliangiales bacterium]
MDLDRARAALLAAAPDAPDDALDGFADAWPRLCLTCAAPLRLAALIGHTAHESGGYRRRTENLYYTTPERLIAVWPGRFAHVSEARGFLRDPEGLANHVYGGRMGNGRPGDGWRYRGRGWLQLTGRENYRQMGDWLGLALEREPSLAARADHAWVIAAEYLARRARDGRTALEWADIPVDAMVTRIVNGGLHGLEDRMRRTASALAELVPLARLIERLTPGARSSAVLAAQILLTRGGHRLGALDGIYGPRTAAAIDAQTA